MLDYRETERNLKTSVKDGVFSSLFTGFTKSYIAPLAIAMKASNSVVALFSSIPELLANVFQLLTINAAKHIASRRNLLVWANLLQVLVWIPIILVPFIAKDNLYLLLALVSISTIIGQFMQPIWNSYMGDIVPDNERGRFFGRRNFWVGIFTLLSTVSAGLVLNHYSGLNPLAGFAIIFAVAVVARLISAYYKSSMSDVAMQKSSSEEFSLWQFIIKMNRTNYGIFVLYITLLKFAVYIATPFFAIYMLRELGFSYWQFAAVTSSSLVSSFLFMTLWGRFIDWKGTRRVLAITGYLVVLVPILWVVAGTGWAGTSLFFMLIAIEAFSGIAWAGFDLSAANFIFDSVRPEKRIRCIAYYNLFIGAGIFLGTALGSFVVEHFHGMFSFSSILIAFIISGTLRLIVSLLFIPRLKEVRLIEVPLGHTLFHRILDIRPRSGFDIVIIDKGPDIIPRRAESLKKAVKQPKPALPKCSTIDIIKKNVEKDVHKRDIPERQSRLDQKRVDTIMDELKRGRYPKEFKRN